MEIKKIEQIAREAHKGQTRWNGDDYITHPIRVSKKMPNDKLKAVALLHDILEDTDVTGHDLLDKGVSQEIVQTVCFLTREKDESYSEYIDLIARSGKSATGAITVKIADLEDNLFDLEDGPQKDKYELALLFLESKLEENENE